MQEQVKCPVCGRRLFDIEEHSTGLIEIKCMHCKQIAKLQLAKICKSKSAYQLGQNTESREVILNYLSAG